MPYIPKGYEWVVSLNGSKRRFDTKAEARAWARKLREKFKTGLYVYRRKKTV